MTSEPVCLALFIVCSIRAIANDIESFRIDPPEIALGIAAVLAAKAVLGCADWADIVAGGVLGAICFSALSRISHGRLGSGDAWFSALIGFSFGFWTWDFGVLAAALFGLVWIAVHRALGRAARIRDIRIPFVPFMFAGAVAVALYRGLSQ